MATDQGTLAGMLARAKMVLDNADSSDEIKKMMKPYGYDEQRLKEGRELLKKVQSLQHEKENEYGRQYQATQALAQARDQANKVYMRLVKIARVALKDNMAAMMKLGLFSSRKASYSGWLAQAKLFYGNLLTDDAAMATMARFGVSGDALKEGQALLDKVEHAYSEQKKEMSEAQQATADRDQAIDALNDWLSDFIAIARIALEERPQLLEQLGVKA